MPHDRSQKQNKRIVYIDVDTELDEPEVDADPNFWVDTEGGISSLCTTNYQTAKNALVCGQSGSVSQHALCAQRAHEAAFSEPLCNADAINDFTTQWPPSEPYSLISPSGSNLKGNRTKRRYNKERHSYAKAILRSDRALEKLSGKIRRDLQYAEMIELAIEAERAANAGCASFSAKPSTFGSDNYQCTTRREALPRRSRALSDGQHLRHKDQHSEFSSFKQIQLRDISEVIPKWGELHHHLRSHMYRRQVGEHTLKFYAHQSYLALDPSVSIPTYSSTSYVPAPPHRSENIEKRKLRTTKSLLSHVMDHRCQPRSPIDNPLMEKRPNMHARNFHLEVASNFFPAPNTLLESGDPQQSKEVLEWVLADCPKPTSGISQDVVLSSTRGHGFLRSEAFHFYSTVSDSSKNDDGRLSGGEVYPMTESADTNGSHKHSSGFQTPICLRDIRGKESQLPHSGLASSTPVSSAGNFEPSSIVESSTIEGNQARGRPDDLICELALEDTLALSLPLMGTLERHEDLNSGIGQEKGNICDEKKEDEYLQCSDITLSQRNDDVLTDFRHCVAAPYLVHSHAVRDHDSSEEANFESATDNSAAFLSATWGADMRTEVCSSRQTCSSIRRSRSWPVSCALELAANQRLLAASHSNSPGDAISWWLPTPPMPIHSKSRRMAYHFRPAIATPLVSMSPRPKTYVNEFDNTNFLSNFLYCTRNRSRLNLDSKSLGGHVCGTSCHDNAADGVCNHIYHQFFPAMGVSNTGTAGTTPRGHERDPKLERPRSKWSGVLGKLLSPCGGSSQDVSVGDKSHAEEKAVFDPPFLKKLSLLDASKL